MHSLLQWCNAGGGYTNTNPELRRIVPDPKGRPKIKVVYVVLEAQYQSSLTAAVKNINATRSQVSPQQRHIHICSPMCSFQVAWHGPKDVALVMELQMQATTARLHPPATGCLHSAGLHSILKSAPSVTNHVALLCLFW